MESSETGSPCSCIYSIPAHHRIPSGHFSMSLVEALSANGPESLVCLCFAFRLENITDGDVEIGRQVLARHGWKFTDWQPKPSLARHMGGVEQMIVLEQK